MLNLGTVRTMDEKFQRVLNAIQGAVFLYLMDSNNERKWILLVIHMTYVHVEVVGEGRILPIVKDPYSTFSYHEHSFLHAPSQALILRL